MLLCLLAAPALLVVRRGGQHSRAAIAGPRLRSPRLHQLRRRRRRPTTALDHRRPASLLCGAFRLPTLLGAVTCFVYGLSTPTPPAGRARRIWLPSHQAVALPPPPRAPPHLAHRQPGRNPPGGPGGRGAAVVPRVRPRVCVLDGRKPRSHDGRCRPGPASGGMGAGRRGLFRETVVWHAHTHAPAANDGPPCTLPDCPACSKVLARPARMELPCLHRGKELEYEEHTLFFSRPVLLQLQQFQGIALLKRPPVWSLPCSSTGCHFSRPPHLILLLRSYARRAAGSAGKPRGRPGRLSSPRPPSRSAPALLLPARVAGSGLYHSSNHL